MKEVRYVSFKNVVYDLGNGNKLKISPIPYWDKTTEDNIIKFGIEKYMIESTGKLMNENIDRDTLKNFDNYLFNHLEALRRLT